MTEPFAVQPLDRPKRPCKFGKWVNRAIPEEAPDMAFRCTALGVEWVPGGKGKKADTDTRCVRCILYKEAASG